MKFKPTFAFLTLLILGCGSYDDDGTSNPIDNGSGNVDKCLNFGASQLKITIQDQFTTLPGKVSVFFKVTENDGKPVTGLTETNFTVYEQGRNDECFNTISSTESSARISPNSQIFRNNTLLVLDLSNSVLSSSLTELKEASKSFINNVMPSTSSDSFKMAIYWFDGEDKLHQLKPLTSEKSELILAIDGITNTISKDPSTDLYGAVIKSANIASGILDDIEDEGIIAAASVVIFTDGTDQASRYTESAALNKVNGAYKNISFFSIGLGAEINTQSLSAIGKTSSAFAENKEELEAIFEEISISVAGQANSFYLFEYCSPKRDGSGTNNLVIRINYAGKQGAVQTRFNATGFTSGCE